MATPLPPNRARFTFAEIASATGGSSIVRSPAAAGEGAPGAIVGIATDTRLLERGGAFIALRGARVDGHALLDQAAERGAALAIVEQDVTAPPGLAVLRVASTLEALGAIARLHTRRWRVLGGERRVIGITGSAGKTTTRVALAALLEHLRPGEVHATGGNLNNRIGAPLVLLGLEPEHRLAVLELGTNQPGEIAALAAICEPDVGVLTLIAAAHCAGLGSIEAVAMEKGALLHALPREGIAVGNSDDPRVARELSRAPARRRAGYGFAEGATYRIVTRQPLGLSSASIGIETRSSPGAEGRSIAVTTPLLGEAGALATAAAIATTELLLGKALDGAVVRAALAAADVGGGAGRLVPRVIGDVALLDDSYNANPASCAASIRAAAEIAAATKRRLVLVLGEMRELGAESAAGHDDVGVAAAASGAAEILAVVGDASRIALRATEHGGSARFAASVAEGADVAVRIVAPGDLVLVKGSRGVETEKIVAALVAANEPRSASGACREGAPRP